MEGMRLVLQRVSQASVTVAGKRVGAIGSGVLVLVGIGHRDAESDVQWAVKRILDTKVKLLMRLRGNERCEDDVCNALWQLLWHLVHQLWPDEQDKPWKHSVRSSGREVLVVSQFTLYGQGGQLAMHCVDEGWSMSLNLERLLLLLLQCTRRADWTSTRRPGLRRQGCSTTASWRR